MNWLVAQEALQINKIIIINLNCVKSLASIEKNSIKIEKIIDIFASKNRRIDFTL